MVKIELQDGIHFVQSAEEFGALLNDYLSPSAKEAFETFVMTADERKSLNGRVMQLRTCLDEILNSAQEAKDCMWDIYETINYKLD